MIEVELCRRFLRRIDELRHQDPGRATEMAENLRQLVAQLDREEIGEPQWLILQGEAWAVLGSAYRGSGRLRKAEEALNVALAFLNSKEAEPHLDPRLRARLAQRAAYLRSDQARGDEALNLMDEALGIYSDHGSHEDLAIALIDRALIIRRCGAPAQAIPFLDQALRLLSPTKNPGPYTAAVHNMALYLGEVATTSEEKEEALAWLRLAAKCHTQYPENLNLLKLRFLEGQLAIRLGRTELGVARLWAAHDGFKKIGAPLEQAVVLLHLAATEVARRRPKDVKKIAGQLFPIFHQLDIDRETQTALRLFYRTAQEEALTMDLVQEVAQKMERTRRRVRSRSRS